METERDLLIATVSSFVIFNVWQIYENNVPSIADLRAAAPGDTQMKQRMIDADMSIGSVALAIGLVFAYKAHDPSIVLIIIALLGALSWWRHEILEGDNHAWKN